MTLSELKTLVSNTRDNLISEGIPCQHVHEVKTSKATSYYGRCKSVVFHGRSLVETSSSFYEITISEALLSCSFESIVNTVVHELLHTIEGCMNHGLLWQSYAEKASKLYNTDIKRCSYNEEFEKIVKEKYIKSSHAIKCTCCGKIIERTRESNVTLHPERYKCKCGGKFIRLY